MKMTVHQRVQETRRRIGMTMTSVAESQTELSEQMSERLRKWSFGIADYIVRNEDEAELRTLARDVVANDAVLNYARSLRGPAAIAVAMGIKADADAFIDSTIASCNEETLRMLARAGLTQILSEQDSGISHTMFEDDDIPL